MHGNISGNDPGGGSGNGHRAGRKAEAADDTPFRAEDAGQRRRGGLLLFRFPAEILIADMSRIVAGEEQHGSRRRQRSDGKNGKEGAPAVGDGKRNANRKVQRDCRRNAISWA